MAACSLHDMSAHKGGMQRTSRLQGWPQVKDLQGTAQVLQAHEKRE